MPPRTRSTLHAWENRLTGGQQTTDANVSTALTLDTSPVLAAVQVVLKTTFDVFPLAMIRRLRMPRLHTPGLAIHRHHNAIALYRRNHAGPRRLAPTLRKTKPWSSRRWRCIMTRCKNSLLTVPTRQNLLDIQVDDVTFRTLVGTGAQISVMSAALPISCSMLLRRLFNAHHRSLTAARLPFLECAPPNNVLLAIRTQFCLLWLRSVLIMWSSAYTFDALSPYRLLDRSSIGMPFWRTHNIRHS